MNDEFKKGDRVQIASIPNWLVHDLPSDEKNEILQCIGKVTEITDVDVYGYFWVEFGKYETEGDYAYCSGHSFCLPRECLRLAE